LIAFVNELRAYCEEFVSPHAGVRVRPSHLCLRYMRGTDYEAIEVVLLRWSC